MAFELGILFAFAALVFWGCGDFLIQKATRRIGDWETLLAIEGIALVVLLPFVFNQIPIVLSDPFSVLILLAASVTMTAAAILDFEGLKRGKIATVEPMLALEVPVVTTLAFFLFNEAVSLLNALLITCVICGVFMVSLRSHHLSRKAWLEKGVLLTGIAAGFMGTATFLTGVSSRATDPLFVNWFMSIVIVSFCLIYLQVNGRLGRMARDFSKHHRIALAVGTCDNIAWISYATAVTLVPFSITLGISESYIALAVLLGLLVNKERLLKHQYAGLILALGGAITLGALY